MTREQCAHRQPFPEKKPLQVQPHHLGLCDQGFGDKDLNTLGFELAVGLQIGFAGISVDRHRGMATSAKRSDIVERNRPFPVSQVRLSVRTNGQVQSFSPWGEVSQGEITNLDAKWAT